MPTVADIVRRHGEGTFVAQGLRSGALEKHQLLLLARLAGQLVDKARTMHVEPARVHALIDETFARPAPSAATRKETDHD